MALRISYTIPENFEEIREAGLDENTDPVRRDPGLLKESVAAYERALNCAKDPDERGSIVRALAAVYSLAGEREKAIALARQQPKLAFSRELMLAEAEEGEEKEQATANALLSLLANVAVTVVLAAPGPGAEIDDEERKAHAKSCVDTAHRIESFFPDGRCGRLHFVLSQLYYYPVCFYAAYGDYANADESFAAMARHEQANRSYEECKEYAYSGTMFGRLKDTDHKHLKVVSTKPFLFFSEEYKAHLKGIPELAAFLDQ